MWCDDILSVELKPAHPFFHRLGPVIFSMDFSENLVQSFELKSLKNGHFYRRAEDAL